MSNSNSFSNVFAEFFHTFKFFTTFAGQYTDEFRVGFRHPVNSAEDAKSELTKLFQEVWEREQGYFFTDDLPPVKKYAEDILRNNNNKK